MLGAKLTKAIGKKNILSDLRELHFFLYRVSLDMEMYPDVDINKKGLELNEMSKTVKMFVDEIKRNR